MTANLSGDQAQRGDEISSPALPGWNELTTEAGEAVLACATELAREGAKLDAISVRLRKEGTDPSLISAALTLVGLRHKAGHKFGANAESFLLTQAGLEQASRMPVSELHAARFSGCASVADLGSGLGAESLAFLRAGLRVRAVELDPLTARFAEHNLAVEAAVISEASDPPQIEPPRFEVLAGDATEIGADGADAVFLDPARRTSGHRDTKRLTSFDDYSPSLDFAFEQVRAARAGGVKLGPGFDREFIPEDAEAQWVSVDGQVVEMGLWFGAAAREGIRRSAAVIRAGEVHELTAPEDAADAEVRELGEYILEPDGAVIRARLIGLLAAQTGAGMLHEHIAYLTSDTAVPTPFAQVFRVLEELPAKEKDLKKALSSRDIGKLEIKKRGVDVDPAALRTRLRLKGKRAATLILTRTADRHLALLAERVA